MNSEVLISTLALAIISGTPLIFAAIGGVLGERSGVLNLGMEGMMLVGAVSAFLANNAFKNASVSFIAAGVAGALLALIHAGLTISLRANQIVSGLALTIFGTGLANYLGTPLEGARLEKTIEPLHLPGLSSIPWIGTILFKQDALVYFSWIVAIVASLYLHRTRTGLGLRAVGENPATADSMGLRVAATRYAHIALGGVLAGFGGAYVILRIVPTWSQAGTIAGLGWIALALVVFAGWRPLRVIAGAYIFGVALQANFALQAAGIAAIPAQFLAMLPYLLTVAILVVLTSRKKDGSGAPAALGLPFVRDER